MMEFINDVEKEEKFYIDVYNEFQLKTTNLEGDIIRKISKGIKDKMNINEIANNLDTFWNVIEENQDTLGNKMNQEMKIINKYFDLLSTCIGVDKDNQFMILKKCNNNNNFEQINKILYSNPNIKEEDTFYNDLKKVNIIYGIPISKYTDLIQEIKINLKQTNSAKTIPEHPEGDNEEENNKINLLMYCFVVFSLLISQIRIFYKKESFDDPAAAPPVLVPGPIIEPEIIDKLWKLYIEIPSYNTKTFRRVYAELWTNHKEEEDENNWYFELFKKAFFYDIYEKCNQKLSVVDGDCAKLVIDKLNLFNIDIDVKIDNIEKWYQFILSINNWNSGNREKIIDAPSVNDGVLTDIK